MKHLRFLLFIIPLLSFAQQESKIIAYLVPENDVLQIEQTLTITNNSQESWDRIVLLDWAHSFSGSETALANRFAEDFKNRFQFASDKDRGRTIFKPLKNNSGFQILRSEAEKDIVQLILEQPMLPGQTRKFCP